MSIETQVNWDELVNTELLEQFRRDIHDRVQLLRGTAKYGLSYNHSDFNRWCIAESNAHGTPSEYTKLYPQDLPQPEFVSPPGSSLRDYLPEREYRAELAYLSAFRSEWERVFDSTKSALRDYVLYYSSLAATAGFLARERALSTPWSEEVLP